MPVPAGTDDGTFLRMYQRMLLGLVKAYDPQGVVLCVGADGLGGDDLVSEVGGGAGGAGGCSGGGGGSHSSSSGDGWNLSPRVWRSVCA